MSLSLSQEHFGATAKDYLTSKPHALGKSLERMVALAQPQPNWHMLDVATGAGHVAYTFAPLVARVWATDITDEMMAIVRDEVSKRGLANVRVAHAKAESLPFEDGTFDLVTCRVAPHHFDSIPRFLAEVRRVLKPGGRFAVVDNVVPNGTVGDFVNVFERFRDPSHLRAWTMDEWRDALVEAGLKVEHEETIDKRMDFASWAQRHDETMKRLILSLLREQTPGVKAFMQPHLDEGPITFNLREGVFLASR